MSISIKVNSLRKAIAAPTVTAARRAISSTPANSFAGHDVDALAASFKGYYVQKNLLQPNPKLKQTHDVRGKTAFISGGSRGIGLDIAKKLAAAGFRVEEVKMLDKIGAEMMEKYRIQPQESLFVCYKD